MVDRFSITTHADELALVLGVEIPDRYGPVFNAAPTKSLPIIKSTRPETIIYSTWGLMAQWSNNKSMSSKFFNVDKNTCLTKANYRKKVLGSRCVIPMDGFYLWKAIGKKKKVPYYFHFPDKRVFTVAGLWETDENGEEAFIMMTAPATKQISEFQENMPAILDTAATKKWLQSSDPEEITAIIEVAKEEEFTYYTVSPSIGDLAIDRAHLINPAPASDQLGNYTLFS